MSTLSSRIRGLFFSEKQFMVAFISTLLLIGVSLFTFVNVLSSGIAYDLNRFWPILAYTLIFFSIAFVLKKKRKDFLLLGVPILFIFLARFVYGLWGFSLFFLASYVVGDWFGDRFKMLPSTLSQLERNILKYFLGHLVLTEVFLILIHLPLNYLPVYLTIFALIIYWGRSKIAKEARSLGSSLLYLDGIKIFSIYSASVFLIFYLLPVYLFEDINTYLFIPKTIIEKGHFWPDLSFVCTFSVVSTYALYTINMMLGGESGVRLMLFFHLAGAIFLLGSFLRRQLSERAALVGVMALVSIPFLFFSAVGLFNEVLDLFLGAGFLILFLESRPQWKKGSDVKSLSIWILGFFSLMAAAFPIRNQVVVILFPLSCLLLWDTICFSRRAGSWRAVGQFLGGCLLFFGISSFWLVRNYLIAKNPLFPMFNKFFKSPFFYDNWDVQTDSLGSVPPLSPEAIYDMTFHFDLTYLYNCFHKFGFGFTFFVFSVVALGTICDKNFRRRWGLVCLLVLASFSVYHCFFAQARYICSALPLFCLAVAAVFSYVMVSYRKIATMCTFSIFGLNYFIQNQGACVVTYPFPIVEALFNPHQMPEVKRWDAIKEFFAVANVMIQKHEKILMYYTQGNYFANFIPQAFDWYFYPVDSKIRKVAQETNNDPYAVYDVVFKDLGFDGMVLTTDEFYGFQRLNLVEKIFTHAGHTIYRPIQNIKVGEIQSFTNSGLGLRVLGSGWHPPEPTGSWSGSHAEMELKIPRYRNRNLRIEMPLFPITRPKETKKFSVTVAGQKRVFEISGEERLNFSIPSHLNSGFIKISFDAPQATSPAALGLDPRDHRELGVHVETIKIFPDP